MYVILVLVFMPELHRCHCSEAPHEERPRGGVSIGLLQGSMLWNFGQKLLGKNYLMQ
jgi:hypothetical protein